MCRPEARRRLLGPAVPEEAPEEAEADLEKLIRLVRGLHRREQLGVGMSIRWTDRFRSMGGGLLGRRSRTLSNRRILAMKLFAVMSQARLLRSESIQPVGRTAGRELMAGSASSRQTRSGAYIELLVTTNTLLKGLRAV